MRSTALRIMLLLGLAILLVGCGGSSSGGGSDDGGSSGGESGGGQQEQEASGEQSAGGESSDAAGGDSKIVLGRIESVNGAAGRFTVQPSTDEQGEDPIAFKLAEGGRITIEGEEAEISDVQEGQQAQVEYVVLGDLNRARVVELFGETTAE